MDLWFIYSFTQNWLDDYWRPGVWLALEMKQWTTIPDLKETTVQRQIFTEITNSERQGLGLAYVQNENTEQETTHLSWLEPTVGCGGIFRLPIGEALKQVLEDNLELAGRGKGKENGILNSKCTYTKAWWQEAFDGHCKLFSMDGV